MSHPSDVEYTEFHNRYAHAQKQAVRVERGHIALDSLSTSQRLAAPGRWDNLRHAASAPRQLASPERKHHRKKHDVGLSACDRRKSHLFIDLPGTTFNAASWERFVCRPAADAAPRSPACPSSPMQRALSTSRAQSPDRIASYRGSAARIKARKAVPQPSGTAMGTSGTGTGASSPILLSPASTASLSLFSASDRQTSK